MKIYKTLFLFFCIHFYAQAQNFDEALWIPPFLEGSTFDLNLAASSKQFFDDVNTNTYGINGDYLGPTLIFNKGDNIQINVNNNLDELATMHWHGMHVSPSNDGGPHNIIESGTTWSPSFKVMDFATTFWYHPHLHMYTTKQVNMGAAGLIIVRDNKEASLNLPRTYGVDDIPLVLQAKSFDEEGQIEIFGGDNELMVNGVLNPYLNCPAQMVRFRVLNAASNRVFNLGMSDNRIFYQIGTDGGLLNHPVPLNRLVIAPGERAELMIDFSQDENQILQLLTYASEFETGIPGASGSGVLDGLDLIFLEFSIGEAISGGVFSIPQNLENHQPYPINDVDVIRHLTMTGPPYYFDNETFDMDVVNEVVHLGDTEIWEIENQTSTAHPFHIHDVQFFVLDIDGEIPPHNQRGRKDVILIEPNETVKFISKFKDFADPDIPYMYHCHLLPHEDFGMMGQFVVIDVPCESKIHLASDESGIACHETKNWIKSEAIILEGAVIDYNAKDFVELKPGFSVEEGASFEIFMEGCVPHEGGSGGQEEGQ